MKIYYSGTLLVKGDNVEDILRESKRDDGLRICYRGLAEQTDQADASGA